MEKLIVRVLATFTVGFLVIGAVLGFVSVADCGSVFSPADSCSATLADQRAFVIAFIGLGLTCLAAAIIADQPAKPVSEDEQPDVEQSPDEIQD